MENKGALAEALGRIIAGISVAFGAFVCIVVYLFSDNILVATVIGICSAFLVDFLLIFNKKLFSLLPVILLKIPFFRNILCKAVSDDTK